MHPILFRIPLPNTPLKLWWALAAVAAIVLVYLVLAIRRKQRNAAITMLVGLAALGGAAYKFRETSWSAENLPIYSYGVMLGISLVIGWYLTLSLAEKDGLPKETMANCYVITALAAIAGSRILYILTNLSDFHEIGDVFALRKGGLVAYGGFVGGFLGSWAYLSSKKIRLMPWADAAVPSLASGLLVTRIGCYLFGCDFGKRLDESAPSWLQKLGTFPHWPEGTVTAPDDGSPAYVEHLKALAKPEDADARADLISMNHSFPVHPTQLYESLVGLLLLALLLWQRKHVKFRGQIFFLFVFAYGVIRFLLEIVRDDPERGSFGPRLEPHIMIPACIALMAVGFAFGLSLSIKNQTARLVARIAAFAPAIALYFLLKPAQYSKMTLVQLSTSQWIALITALLVSYFYAQYWQEGRRNPTMAMSLGQGATPPREDAATDEDDEAEPASTREPQSSEPGDTQTATPAAKKTTKKKKATKASEDEAGGAEAEESEEPKPKPAT